MHRDPLYWSDGLVQLLDQDLVGFHPGCRAVHASGRLNSDTFHPTAVAKQASRAVQTLPGPVSFTRSACHASRAYRFVNAAGVGRLARHYWKPVAEPASQPPAQLRQQPTNHLYEALERRLQGGPIVFALELGFAEDGDPADDRRVLRPEGRERMAIGRLELTRPISLEDLGDLVMPHDVTRVTDGIELSVEPILPVRRGACRAFVAQRTGDWQQRHAAAAERAPAPFHAS